MDFSLLENCSLFSGLTASQLRDDLQSVPQHIQYYEKDELIFHFMESAQEIGIILSGRVLSVKPFPNGNQVNVSVRYPGDLIGPAAAFSNSHLYPCDVKAQVPASILMFRKEDILQLMQKDVRILENFTREMATAAYILQDRLELLSYKGIAQKAAYYLLMRARRAGISEVQIPGSISSWAQQMNVSRPSLHRELKAMEEKGIIDYSAHVITIKNSEALQNLLEQ